MPDEPKKEPADFDQWYERMDAIVKEAKAEGVRIFAILYEEDFISKEERYGYVNEAGDILSLGMVNYALAGLQAKTAWSVPDDPPESA